VLLSKPKIAETLTLKPDHFSGGRPFQFVTCVETQ
jgi:hypothetical protein